MAVNIETAIKWMENKQGHVTYSMNQRNGTRSYDCSSSIYYALRSGGATNNGWAVSTESMHSWLLKNGFECITQNRPWTAKRGDIFIWGRKGHSGGANGHTGMFVSGQDIIHCNFSNNGISVDNHDTLWFYNRQPYYYAYRLKTYSPNTGKKTMDQLAREVIAGKWGNNPDRFNQLKAKGYNPIAVQRQVDKLLKSPEPSKDLTAIAKRVIDGDFGNNPIRGQKLTKLGYDVNAVQKIVNKMLK